MSPCCGISWLRSGACLFPGSQNLTAAWPFVQHSLVQGCSCLCTYSAVVCVHVVQLFVYLWCSCLCTCGAAVCTCGTAVCVHVVQLSLYLWCSCLCTCIIADCTLVQLSVHVVQLFVYKQSSPSLEGQADI